ncbi:UpxY family transcription antiterminator [Compostibacter hankyongensis]|uniref:UpxY family transcription antiterminator n=1 Tax=Compostibacter hankyongensis TaxID=1007089 RepID=A0ABP8FUT8_9BACT
MSWYVLYTKSRNEKKVAELLTRKGIEVYCPLQEEVRQWSDRKKKVKLPVFRSYVFVRLDHYKEESVPVLMTPGAVRFLWWLGKPGVVRDTEIQAIRHFLMEHTGSEITVELHQGEKVSITTGPFREQEGTLVAIQGSKAILYIDSLGIRLKAELPVAVLQPKK